MLRIKLKYLCRTLVPSNTDVVFQPNTNIIYLGEKINQQIGLERALKLNFTRNLEIIPVTYNKRRQLSPFPNKAHGEICITFKISAPLSDRP